MTLVPLAWYHLGLILYGLWNLNLDCELERFWEHLFYIHLGAKLRHCLACNLEITLEHGKDIVLDFNLAQWLYWWLALEKNFWLAYHWELQLHPYLNIQIMELYLVICLRLWLAWYLACFLEVFLDPWLTLFGISIGVVLGLALGNYFDN